MLPFLRWLQATGVPGLANSPRLGIIVVCVLHDGTNGAFSSWPLMEGSQAQGRIADRRWKFMEQGSGAAVWQWAVWWRWKAAHELAVSSLRSVAARVCWSGFSQESGGGKMRTSHPVPPLARGRCAVNSCSGQATGGRCVFRKSRSWLSTAIRAGHCRTVVASARRGSGCPIAYWSHEA